MPLALWALHRLLTTRSVKSLAAFVLFALVQCLSNNYFIYFLALPAVIIAVHGLSHARPEHRFRFSCWPDRRGRGDCRRADADRDRVFLGASHLRIRPDVVGRPSSAPTSQPISTATKGRVRR